jgi:hypothetical protein
MIAILDYILGVVKANVIEHNDGPFGEVQTTKIV